jgi:hypothetical protein
MNSYDAFSNKQDKQVLSQLLTKPQILARLEKIFPLGSPQRQFCVRDLSASTIYAMLYIGAIEGTGIYLSPKHVYRMTEQQSLLTDESSREEYREKVLLPKAEITGKRWYADNTREPIRDETLREGLVYVGAVFTRTDIATTSSKPRYALKRDFANLFEPNLEGEQLDLLIADWQANNLTKGALARLHLLNQTSLGNNDYVLVDYPNRETRRLAVGPSSVISKAVIEVFAKNFLENPLVLWLSESGNKIITRDEELARKIGIEINVSNDLPDIILVDLANSGTLIIFIEVVATDGAITDRRREALLKITDKGNFSRSDVLFVTAYADKSSPAFKRTIDNVAWNSVVWFASEPNNIVILKEEPIKLSKMKGMLGLSR